MILLIDNYDSFTYNLVQMIGAMNPEIKVIRNDACQVDEIEQKKPTHIILSPGPGYPKNAGICEDVVRKLQGKIPILGVCLGHQGICEVYGGEIIHAKQLMHGKKSRVKLDMESALFKGLPEHLDVARYHSLAADPKCMPKELRITATAENGEIMAVEHVKYPVFGVQFHPESILTQSGERMMRNFLDVRIRM